MNKVKAKVIVAGEVFCILPFLLTIEINFNRRFCEWKDCSHLNVHNEWINFSQGLQYGMIDLEDLFISN